MEHKHGGAQAHIQSRLDQVRHTNLNRLPVRLFPFRLPGRHLFLSLLRARDSAVLDPNLGPVLAVPTHGSGGAGGVRSEKEMERTWWQPIFNPFAGVLDLVWPKGSCRVRRPFHGILRSFVQRQALDQGLWS